MSRATAAHGKLQWSDVELVLQERRQTIRQTEILDFIPATEQISDIGGLDHFKELQLRRGGAFSEKARQYGLPHPKGLLLVGIQGTGKSLTAKAIAHHWHLPLLRLDVGRLFGGLVGESESRTRQTIQLAEALAPCVLWIDEIDKAFAGLGGKGDAGTSSRVFGTFITWMAEKSTPVFVVATANDIQSLPPELLRKGRFDEIFFVDLPTLEERTDIFNIHLRRRRPELSRFDTDQLAKMADGFSGAEIEQALIAAMYDAFSQDREFTQLDIIAALKSTMPLSKTMTEQVTALRDWARQRARPAAASVADYIRQEW